MLSRLFRFHKCSATTVPAAINSGSPCGAVITGVSFRQYTTNIPITAGVSTLPRYSIVFGIAFPFGNTRNGSALVANVVTATVRMIAKDTPTLTGMFPPPDVFSIKIKSRYIRSSSVGQNFRFRRSAGIRPLIQRRSTQESGSFSPSTVPKRSR